LLCHSVVLPSEVRSRARGTVISVLPKLPVSERVRLPCRWPTMPAEQASSLFALPYRGRASAASSSPQMRLDELANPFAHTALDRIKPVVEKVAAVSLQAPKNQTSW